MSAELLGTIGTVFVCLGAVVVGIAAFGVLRLPDLYARLSALTLGSGLGLVLVLIGLLLHFPSVANAVKIALAILIQLGTAAVAGNVVSRSGYLTGAPRTPLTHTDELATAGGPARTDLEQLVALEEAGEPSDTD